MLAVRTTEAEVGLASVGQPACLLGVTGLQQWRQGRRSARVERCGAPALPQLHVFMSTLVALGEPTRETWC